MANEITKEGDGSVSMKIFAATLGGGTGLIFFAQLLPEKFTGILSVIGAVIVAGGLLWLSTRRMHMRLHASDERKH